MLEHLQLDRARARRAGAAEAAPGGAAGRCRRQAAVAAVRRHDQARGAGAGAGPGPAAAVPGRADLGPRPDQRRGLRRAADVPAAELAADGGDDHPRPGHHLPHLQSCRRDRGRTHDYGYTGGHRPQRAALDQGLLPGRTGAAARRAIMEREANYAAVGAFVLLLVAMAGAFVYWYSDTRDTRNYVALRDLFRRQRQRPVRGRRGALPRRRHRARAPHPPGPARGRPRAWSSSTSTPPRRSRSAPSRSSRCWVSPGCCTSTCSSTRPARPR